MKTTAYYHTLAILIVILLISSICICPVAAQTKTDRVIIQSDACENEKVIDNFVIKVKNFTHYIWYSYKTLCPILLHSGCDNINWNNYGTVIQNNYHICTLDSNLSLYEKVVSYLNHDREDIRNEKCSGYWEDHLRSFGDSEIALKGTIRASYDNNVTNHEFLAEIYFIPVSIITQLDGMYTKEFTIYPEDRHDITVLNLKIDLNHPTNEEINIAESIVRLIDTSKNFEDLGILINAAPSHLYPLPIASACLTIPLTDDLIIHPCFIDNASVGLATSFMRDQIKTTAALKTQINNEISEYNKNFIRK